MPIHELKEQIARLPEQPGVYLYFNAAGDTIYVGKARALRDRVRNYLGAYGSDPKTDALLDDLGQERVDQKIGELKWPDQRCRRMKVYGLPQKSIERTLMSPTDLCCPAGVDKFDAVPDIENDPIDGTYKRSESG